MMRIENVVCPVDFTRTSRRELDVALEIHTVFGSRIMLYHNVSAMPVGLSRGWEFDELHRGAEPGMAEAERRLRELMAGLPRAARAEARISRGSAVPALTSLVEGLPADLVILGSHGASSPDHASLSERILDLGRCPVLSLPDSEGGAPLGLAAASPDRLLDAAVATDFSAEALAAVRYAIELARRVPMRLHLLHVARAGAAAAAEKLAALRPADLADRIETCVLAGDAGEQILAFMRDRRPALLFMGQHARGVLRRLLTSDTAAQMLHAGTVPVWYVPTGRTA